MKYKVMYTAGAKRDLRNIFRYISEELLAPENAARQTDRPNYGCYSKAGHHAE
jgi:toxin ParE1/3/4